MSYSYYLTIWLINKRKQRKEKREEQTEVSVAPNPPPPFFFSFSCLFLCISSPSQGVCAASGRGEKEAKHREDIENQPQCLFNKKGWTSWPLQVCDAKSFPNNFDAKSIKIFTLFINSLLWPAKSSKALPVSRRRRRNIEKISTISIVSSEIL